MVTDAELTAKRIDPTATCYRVIGGYVVVCHQRVIGFGPDETEAWATALGRLARQRLLALVRTKGVGSG